MAEVKRYDLETTMSGYSSMEEWSEGEYVLYSDHTTIVAALERRLHVMELAVMDLTGFQVVADDAIQRAEREIDSEQKEQQK